MVYKKIILKDVNNFELKDIFECGQCFRWKKEPNGSYTGVVKIGVLNVSKFKSMVEICGYINEQADLKSFCQDYFDLNTDYDKAKK